MSAYSWRICPRCKIKNDEANAKKLSGVEKPNELKETLREDYEIGIDEDGLFYVNYGGRCDECGLVYKFNHEEEV